MSMQQMLNIMRLQASLVSNNKTFTRLGTITGYDPTTCSAQVLLLVGDDTNQPLQTGWLPVASQWIGNQWGAFFPPNPGDLVEVHFQDGNLQTGYVGLRFFTDEEQPLPVESGEGWLVHKSGSFLKFTNDGKVLINGNVEIDISAPVININVTGSCAINAQGSATINSPEVNLGDVSHGTLEAMMNSKARDVYNTHTHPVPGGGDTGAPHQQVGTDALTNNVRAT